MYAIDTQCIDINNVYYTVHFLCTAEDKRTLF